MTVRSYAKAVSLALGEAMDADGRVFVLGEDVAHGGAYGATQGLLDRFGPDRVRDTPISEAAIVGYSVGAALAGMRPVAEQRLRSAGALDDVTRDALWKEAAEAIDAAVAAAESAPMPDAAEALEDVFAGTIEEGWA